MRPRLASVLFLASLLALTAVSSAHAAFPGQNGKIVYDRWVVSGFGTDTTQLTNSPAQDIEPAWSPDGREIVFLLRPKRHLRSVHDECGRHRCHEHHEHSGPALRKPAGVVTRWPAHRVLLRSDLCDEPRRKRPQGPFRTAPTELGFRHGPAWSPDGTKIVFTRDIVNRENYESHGRIMNAAGGIGPVRRFLED
jgi:Tol biopolymer transport system component